MMFFINMNTLNWLEKAFNLKINIFLKLFCPVGAAPGEKKMVLCVILFSKNQNFKHFSMPYNINLTSGTSKLIYLLYFSNIIARMSASFKI